MPRIFAYAIGGGSDPSFQAAIIAASVCFGMALLIGLSGLRSRKKEKKPIFSPTFWYVFATAMGLSVLAVVLAVLHWKDPIE